MANSREVKVLVLVLSSEDSPWREIQKLGQDSTFMTDAVQGLRFLGYYGDSDSRANFFLEFLIFLKRCQNAFSRMFSTRLGKFMGKILSTSRVGDNHLKVKFGAITSNQEKGPDFSVDSVNGIDAVSVPTPDRRPLIGLKTLLAFQYAVEHHEFDYLFRTNTSSFINGHALMKIARAADRTHLYAGAKVEIFNDDTFATGSGYLLSRDVVEKISSSPELWPLGVADDVALAFAIKSLPGEKIERVDFPFFHPKSQLELESLDSNLINGFPHIRCKSESPNETINMMHYLWRINNAGF